MELAAIIISILGTLGGTYLGWSLAARENRSREVKDLFVKTCSDVASLGSDAIELGGLLFISNPDPVHVRSIELQMRTNRLRLFADQTSLQWTLGESGNEVVKLLETFTRRADLGSFFAAKKQTSGYHEWLVEMHGKEAEIIRVLRNKLEQYRTGPLESVDDSC